jgi:hypothetical protein
MHDASAPDWKSLVRGHMPDLQLDAAQREEIVTELASHLEEVYEGLCTEGLRQPEALSRALEKINWRQLARKIQSAKRKRAFMNGRTRQFWLPALVSLAISEGVLLGVSVSVGTHSRLLMAGPKMIYLPWLVSLPIAGAVGACLSRRAGSERKISLAAALFPAAVGLGFIFVGVAIALITGARVFARPQWLYASRALGVGVVLPAVALLLGSLPFLKRRGLNA